MHSVYRLIQAKKVKVEPFQPNKTVWYFFNSKIAELNPRPISSPRPRALHGTTTVGHSSPQPLDLRATTRCASHHNHHSSRFKARKGIVSCKPTVWIVGTG